MKKLLEFSSESADISAAKACKFGLFPLVKKENRLENKNNPYPVWAAEAYFQKVSINDCTRQGDIYTETEIMKV